MAARYNLPCSVKIGTPDRFLLQNRYTMDDGSDFYLFVNASRLEGKSTDITFPASITKGRKAWIYDPATGKRHPLKLDASGKVHFDFGPSESFVFMFNKMGGEATALKKLPVSGANPVEVKDWAVTLVNPEVPDVPGTVMADLVDLKDTEEYKNFMGTATYTARFTVSGALPKYLNLGKVGYIAEVKINDKPAGLHWYGDAVLPVDGLVKAGDNTIEVKVTTLMSNYMQTLKDNRNAQRFVLRRNTPLKPAGLIGPVTLY